MLKFGVSVLPWDEMKSTVGPVQNLGRLSHKFLIKNSLISFMLSMYTNVYQLHEIEVRLSFSCVFSQDNAISFSFFSTRIFLFSK